MASIHITLDKNGNYKSSQVNGLDYFYQISFENGILTDSVIYSYGCNPPIDLFRGIATCFNILEVFSSSNPDIPEWLSFNINIDLNNGITKRLSVATQYGFREITSTRYIRTTTIRALPQSNNGATRYCTLAIDAGCYLGTILDNLGFYKSGSSINDRVYITIQQDANSPEDTKFSNPYYRIKRDNIIVEDFTEVHGVARIDINVLANGVEYYANKLALGMRCYDYKQSNPMWLESSILVGSSLRVTGTPNWISYNIELDLNENFYDYARRYFLALTYSPNTSENQREGVLILEYDDGYESHYVKYEIHIHLYGMEEDGGGDLPDPPTPIQPEGFVVIDTNTGENYDNSELLFKDNNANIYSTLEAKDNTLFLGNYLNSNFSLLIKNAVGDLSSIEITDTTFDTIIAKKNNSTYSYTPDMTSNSQLKRLFKKGETYSLGLVFIKNNGVKSSVFYIGDYNPQDDPVLIENGNTYLLRKHIASIHISTSLSNSLKSVGVIGIIPVYAQRGNHKVICLGFLNPTITSSERNSSENLTSLYNWFLRLSINNTGTALGEYEDGHNYNHPEFQSRNDDGTWTFNKDIITMNTPEMEAIDSLTNAELESCQIHPIWESGTINFINSILLNVNGKYLHSRIITPDGGYSKTDRETCVGIWHGYLDKGTIKETDAAFIIDTRTDDNLRYGTFFVYPWLRNTVGGEGPDSVITSKKYFTSLYIDNVTLWTNSLGTVIKAGIYRDTYPALLKFDTDIYLGNIDYIINTNKPYKAYISLAISHLGTSYSYPKANSLIGVYSGYNSDGEITDPIHMRYRVAPHLALKIEGMPDLNNGIICAELVHSNESYVFENDPQVLSSLTWIKCGDIVRLLYDAEVRFIEGDYFYGRFDTLRTFPYALDDVNSVTDIVSGMLCSRINLDSRCDRNRGIGTALVTSENFNIFNPVYNQSNNYFTYLYVNLTDSIYDRTYSNSVLWSMTKNYGNEVDDWCNILEVNTLDLDGNKGCLRALLRLNNNIIAFQDSGISQILYNESMLVAATSGVPIEIANSGKVNGKRYLYENIGCQNEEALTVSPAGIYFVDTINKSFYRLSPNGELFDLCLKGGMKSWGLKNIDTSCRCWYDLYSLEVIFTDYNYGLVYSDTFDRFQCFASYEKVDKVFSLNGRTYIMYYSNMVPIVGGTNGNIRKYYTLWGKNFLDKCSFFGKMRLVEIEIVANPEPTLDKTFTNIEYRADAFADNKYYPWKTFDKVRVWNEYLDTGNVSLVNLYGKPSNLKKKFRTWYINIPRNSVTTDKGKTLDRIRNPWCNIKLSSNMINIDKLVLHDIQVLYLSL